MNYFSEYPSTGLDRVGSLSSVINGDVGQPLDQS